MSSRFHVFSDKPLIDWTQTWLQNHWALLAWLTNAHTPLNFCHYLASNWSRYFLPFADTPLMRLSSRATEFPFVGLPSVVHFLRICRPIADRIQFKFGGWTHYGPLLAWMTLGHAPRNPRRFVAFNNHDNDDTSRIIPFYSCSLSLSKFDYRQVCNISRILVLQYIAQRQLQADTRNI